MSELSFGIDPDVDHVAVLRQVEEAFRKNFFLLPKATMTEQGRSTTFSSTLHAHVCDDVEASTAWADVVQTDSVEYFPKYRNYYTRLQLGYRTSHGAIASFDLPTFVNTEDKPFAIDFGDKDNASEDATFLAPLSISLNHTVREPGCTESYKSYFWVTVSWSLGLEGNRHLQTEAMLRVLEEDIAVNGPWPELAADIDRLRDLHATFQAIETNSELIDFSAVYGQLDQAVAECTQAFPAVSLMTDNQVQGAVDVHTATVHAFAGTVPSVTTQVSMMDDIYWSLWFQRFDEWWGGDTTNIVRVKKFWQAQFGTALWEAFMKNPWRGGKGTWPAVVEMLDGVPFTEQVCDTFLGFLTGDPNWPGFAEAYTVMLKKVNTHRELVQRQVETLMQSMKSEGETVEDFWAWHDILAGKDIQD